jgi:anti-sigma factor RsiW
MNPDEIVLKVQAFVDGELPAEDQAETAALIARDADVAALVKELKQTRQALSSYTLDWTLPESREFYWSKIEREIDRLPQEAPRNGHLSLAALLWRWLFPAGCVAGLVAAGFLFWQSPWSEGDEVAWQAADDNVNAFTYRDYNEGLTVMWLSFPGDNAVADSDEAVTIN